LMSEGDKFNAEDFGGDDLEDGETVVE
jgi:hypothetical protein